jgi:hypothetical protein
MQFAIGLTVMEYKDCLKLLFNFNQDVLDPEHSAEMAAKYLAILEQVVIGPKASVTQLCNLVYKS